jgi:hypothetical protein
MVTVLKRYPRSFTFLLILAFLVSMVIFLPVEVRSEPTSGTTPILSPGDTYEIVVDEVAESSILWWGWFSSENVTFWIEEPNGTTITTISAYDSILVQQSGDYKLIWKNDNSLVSLQVTYSYENFEPQSGLTAPTAGTTISNLTPTIHGKCDSRAVGVRISMDNVTFQEVLLNNSTWSWNATLSSGQNAIYVESTYWNGFFEYRHTQPYELNVDTLWLYEENGNTRIGLGTIGVAIVAILLIFLAVYSLRKRKK